MKFSDTVSNGTLTTILRDHLKVFNLNSGDHVKYDIIDKIRYEWSIFCDLDVSSPGTWQDSWERFINYAVMARSIALTQDEVKTSSKALLEVVPEFSNMRDGSNVLEHIDITYSIEKISGKWEPFIDGNYLTGLKCYEVERSSLTVNYIGGFSRKQNAIEWVTKCLPISSTKKKRGVCRYVWARSWKQAEELVEMELAEIIEFNDHALLKAYLYSIPVAEIDSQSLRAGLKVKASGTKLEKILFTVKEIIINVRAA